MNCCCRILGRPCPQIWQDVVAKSVRLIDWLVVSLRRVGSIGHIHGENCFFFIQTGHSNSISTHNQFVPIDTYEIKILDIKMSNCYFSIKFYDCLGQLYEAVQTSCTQSVRRLPFYVEDCGILLIWLPEDEFTIVDQNYHDMQKNLDSLGFEPATYSCFLTPIPTEPLRSVVFSNLSWVPMPFCPVHTQHVAPHICSQSSIKSQINSYRLCFHYTIIWWL